MATASRISILNRKEFFEKYNPVKVSSASIFISGNTLNPEGLFSTELFGLFGSEKRFKKFGYIDLKTKVLHPLPYHLLKSALNKFTLVLNGQYRIDFDNDGKIVFVKNDDILSISDNDITGYVQVYKNWDKIVKGIPDTGTKERKELIELLNKKSRDELWIDFWPVIPAALREINLIEFEQSGVINYEEINNFYISIINLNNSIDYIDFNSNFNPMNLITDNNIINKIQNQIYQLHSFITRDKVSGKTGFIRKNGLKKAVIYSAGDVIVMAPQFQDNYNSKLTNNIKTGEIGVPVTVLLDVFYPFVLHKIKSLLELELDGSRFKEFVYSSLELDESKYTLSEAAVEFIERCIGDLDYNSEVITNEYLEDNRPLYVMDFLKNIVLLPILGDRDNPKKFVLGTRYPISGLKSNQVLFPVPYTTSHVTETKNIYGGVFHFTEDPKNYSTPLVVNQASLGNWGGDFDGDKIIIVGIFLDESNRDIIKNKSHYRVNNLSLDLKPSTLVGIENLVGLNYITS
jgi:hypothetical protein